MKWLGRLGMVALGVTCPLLALEVGLRLLYPEVPLIERHPQFGTLTRPNLDVRRAFGGHERVVRVSTNASGLRGPGLPASKPPGTRQILAVGDSFTFGDAVQRQEAWPAQLEERLRRDGAGSVEVVNAGVPGYGTAQAMLLYADLEPRLRPDVAILGVSIVNDVLDNLCIEEGTYRPKTTAPCAVLENGRLRLVPPGGAGPAAARRWRPRLRALEFTFNQAKRLVLWNPGMLELLGRVGVQPRLPYMPATVASWYDARYSEPGWRLTARLLLELRDRLAERGTPLVILVVPSSLQVDPALQTTLRRLAGEHPAVLAFFEEPTKPQRLILDLCARQGLACVDPLPAILGAARGGTQIYYAIDNHWTPAGHAIAAEVLEDRLRHWRLLKSEETATARDLTGR